MPHLLPEIRRSYQNDLYKRPDQRKRRAKQEAKRRRRKRERIFAREAHTCVYCGAQPPTARLTIDHVIPLHHFGPDIDDNKVTACDSCNRRRGTRSYEMFMSEMRADYVPTFGLDVSV